MSINKDKLFNFEEARKLFKEPEVVDPENTPLVWSKPKAEELKKFMEVFL